MKREDVFWLLVKGLGLYLLYIATMQVPALGEIMSRGEESGTEQLLHVVVPLAVGLLLVGDGPRLLSLLERRGSGGAAAQRESAPPAANPSCNALARQDLLWVAMKVAGVAIMAYVGSSAAYALEVFASPETDSGLGGGFFLLSLAVVLFGLELTFGSTVYRLAVRR